MKERVIRPLKPEDMNDYMGIYLNAYPAGKDLSEECYDKYYNRNMESLKEYKHVNFFGMYEDDVLVSTMKLIDFDMNFFGEMRRATGLMALGVHPLHKKKGIAREMVRFFEAYTANTGGVVAMLLPFRMDFYKKLGYGCGTKLEEYHVPTEYLPECRDVDSLRFLTLDETDEAIECYRRFVRKNHGAVGKFEEEIRDMRSDEEVRRLGYFDGEELKGYVAFTFVNTSDCNYTLNLMDVKELVYDDEEVLKVLLGGLRMQSDLAQSVIIRTGEPDFYHRLDSCQDVSGNYIDFGFLQTNVSAIGTMYKIVDMKNFVESSAHRQFAPIELKVGFSAKEMLSDMEQRFTLTFAKDEFGLYSHWSYDESELAYEEADVRVECNMAELSSLLMGSAEFAGLVRLGVMKVDKPEYIKKLDMLLHAEQKPFTNTDY